MTQIFEEFNVLKKCFEGDIYVFGRNDFGQLGNQIQDNPIIPLKICSNNKFDDLISHPFFYFPSALTIKGENYFLGKMWR
jgi:hypothetical protein